MKIEVKENELKLWAPCCWYLLHLLAYQMQEKKVQKPDRCFELFKFLGKVLPCPKCQDHFKSYYKNHPIKQDTNLVDWTHDYHNDVNKITNKPLLSKEDVHELFYVEKEIPVNHSYFNLMLRIFYIFHKEEGTMNEFNKFLKLLRKVYPCNRCRLELKKNKKLDFKGTIKIFSGQNCKEAKKKTIKEQKFNIVKFI